MTYAVSQSGNCHTVVETVVPSAECGMDACGRGLSHVLGSARTPATIGHARSENLKVGAMPAGQRALPPRRKVTALP